MQLFPAPLPVQFKTTAANTLIFFMIARDDIFPGSNVSSGFDIIKLKISFSEA